MKARFALDLTNDAVALLERGADGWLRLGEARFDDPALETRLADLRAMAEARAPEGFVSKLIIPASQILYFECQVTGPDQATRRAEIRAMLDGRTPYRLEDLAFDFSRAGDRARVAVVAKITLTEAEEFAFAYGFRPVAHVATPEGEQFAGEPFFGLTTVAAEMLPEGVRYDRDQDPVRALGGGMSIQVDVEPDVSATAAPAQLPETMALEESETPETPAVAEVDEAPFVALDDLDELAAYDLPDAMAEGTGAGRPLADTIPAATDGETGEEPDPLEAGPPSAEEPQAGGPEDDHTPPLSAGDADEAAGADGAEPQGIPESEPPAESAPETVAEGGDAAPSARAENDTTDTHAEEITAGGGGEDAAADATHPALQEALVALAQSAASLTEPAKAAEATPVTPEPDNAGMEDAPAQDEDTQAPAPPAPDDGLVQDEDTPPAADDPMPEGLVTAFQSRRKADAEPDAGMSDEPGARLAAILPRLGGVPAAARKGLSLSPLANEAAAVPALGAALSGVSDAPSALGPEAAPRRPARMSAPGLSTLDLSPRVLVPLAAALLAVAFLAWTFLLTRGQDTPVATGNPVTVATAPDPVPDAQPEGSRTVDLPQPQVRTDPPLPTEPGAADEGSAQALGASDTDPAESDPGVIPDAAALTNDRPLEGQPLPPAFGSILRYGPDGLIVATPEGVITPGGFLLVSGRPPRLPPARPAGLVPPPPPTTASEPAAADLPFADPALRGKRPRPKPEGMVFPAPTDPADETALPAATPEVATAALGPLAPPVDPRHAAKKPRARPATVLAAAEAERAEAEAVEAALKSASKLAVASSRRPPPRSAKAVAAAAAAALAVTQPELTIDNGAVEAALAEAQAAEEATEAPAPEVVATQDIDEPEPEDGIANMPTTRTVAKKSTFANAIDLGDVQLIGVYGSSSNRRALVRMPNGGMKKVQLGDRLDGGRVVAIGAAELVYEKKGRTIRLTIMGRG